RDAEGVVSRAHILESERVAELRGYGSRFPHQSGGIGNTGVHGVYGNGTVVHVPTALALDGQAKVVRGKTVYGTTIDIHFHPFGGSRAEVVPIIKDPVPVKIGPEAALDTDVQGEGDKTAAVAWGSVLHFQDPLPEKRLPVQGGKRTQGDNGSPNGGISRAIQGVPIIVKDRVDVVEFPTIVGDQDHPGAHGGNKADDQVGQIGMVQLQVYIEVRDGQILKDLYAAASGTGCRGGNLNGQSL